MYLTHNEGKSVVAERFIRTLKIKMFGVLLAFNSRRRLKSVSVNNQACQAKLRLVNINFNEPLWYPFIINVDKWGGSCNTTDDPYALFQI